MTSLAHRVRYTYDEYLALEESSNVRHEFLDGQMYAMAGGTPQHAALTTTFANLLFPQLRKGRCRAVVSDLRVRTPSGLSTYPDLTVVCGPRAHDVKDVNAIINPTLIVEVLSPSTESYDRGDKFEHYRTLPSLEAYVLVSQTERRIEVFSPNEGEWTSRVFVEGEAAVISALSAAIPISELYAAAEPGI